ncbi:MAG: hypothetical protein K2W82_11030 [Candidatus Obscuribacterales bacterium]|nr:hypothetical protein [Candidatus Obscuribacterales bacterium]
MKWYKVLVGIVRFSFPAESPCQAIELLRARIEERRHQAHDEEISMSLVEALDAGRLNFLVLNHESTVALAGLLHGQYQEPPSSELILAFTKQIGPEVRRQTAKKS